MTSQARVRSQSFITFITRYLEVWAVAIPHVPVVQWHRRCQMVALRTRISSIQVLYSKFLDFFCRKKKTQHDDFNFKQFFRESLKVSLSFADSFWLTGWLTGSGMFYFLFQFVLIEVYENMVLKISCRRVFKILQHGRGGAAICLSSMSSKDFFTIKPNKPDCWVNFLFVSQ